VAAAPAVLRSDRAGQYTLDQPGCQEERAVFERRIESSWHVSTPDHGGENPSLGGLPGWRDPHSDHALPERHMCLAKACRACKRLGRLFARRLRVIDSQQPPLFMMTLIISNRIYWKRTVSRLACLSDCTRKGALRAVRVIGFASRAAANFAHKQNKKKGSRRAVERAGSFRRERGSVACWAFDGMRKKKGSRGTSCVRAGFLTTGGFLRPAGRGSKRRTSPTAKTTRRLLFSGKKAGLGWQATGLTGKDKVNPSLRRHGFRALTGRPVHRGRFTESRMFCWTRSDRSPTRSEPWLVRRALPLHRRVFRGRVERVAESLCAPEIAGRRR